MPQIKFWIICLANLLKNFRWLNYQLKPYFVQGDKSHLYVIQFTRYSSSPPRGDSFSLAQLQAFVKHFFKIFKSFCWCLSLFAEACQMISYQLPFVKYFFSSFFQAFAFLHLSSLSLADSLHILAQQPAFVKLYFSLFRKPFILC